MHLLKDKLKKHEVAFIHTHHPTEASQLLTAAAAAVAGQQGASVVA